MKSRHLVTLGVFLLVAALLAGVLLRLQDASETGESAETDAAADSLRAEVGASSASAFAADVAVEVEGARARRDTFVLWVRAEGRAEPARSSALLAEVAGPVVEVPVREGDAVRRGALVARIDSTAYALDVRRAAAELESAEARFEELTLFDDRLEDAELREERRRQARIRAGLTSAEVRLEEARMELGKTAVRSPFSGVVANLQVSEGARVRTGDSIARVLDLSEVEVAVQVLEREVPHLEPGRTARVRFTALPDRQFRGRVVSVNPLVGRDSRTARVTVRLENPRARILPGMYAEVEIQGRLFADRVFVPREAIVERDRRDVVFVFEPEEPGGTSGRAKWRYVTTGLENDAFVEIVPDEETSTVEPGEVVLVDGHTTLVHDALVRVSGLPQGEAGEGEDDG